MVDQMELLKGNPSANRLDVLSERKQVAHWVAMSENWMVGLKADHSAAWLVRC